MVQNDITVSIGLSVYNEEHTIGKILHQILSLQDSINLQNIYVNNDGSTDESEAEIHKIHDARIVLLGDKQQKGKAHRMNQILDRAGSDILIFLDADIFIDDLFFFRKLIAPLIADNTVMFTSALSKPHTPQTFIEKVINEEYEIRIAARNYTQNNLMYYSEGSNRALRKSLYKQMRFTSSVADDVFPYLYCVEQGFVFRPVTDTQVRYALPKTVGDYISQMKRYLQSKNVQSQHFSKKTIQQSYTVTKTAKLKAFIKRLIQSPITTLLYGCLVVIPHIHKFVYTKYSKELWSPARTTKAKI